MQFILKGKNNITFNSRQKIMHSIETEIYIRMCACLFSYDRLM